MGISAEAQEQAEEVKRESYGIELGVIQDMMRPATSRVRKASSCDATCM